MLEKGGKFCYEANSILLRHAWGEQLIALGKETQQTLHFEKERGVEISYFIYASDYIYIHSP